MSDNKKDFEKLCFACRTGDVDIIESLISNGVNLNSVDKFDNSPLFLASLCGHESVVTLLLQRGAVCDRDRYEGARCIYGALTDRIRDILLAYDVSKAVDVVQPFATHISSLLREPIVPTSDLAVFFEGSDAAYNLHKFIIQANCSVMVTDFHIESLTDKLILNNFPIKNENEVMKMEDRLLSLIIKFIYLVPILYEIKPLDYSILRKYADHFKLDILSQFIDQIYHVADPSTKSALMIEFQTRITETSRANFNDFLNRYILQSYKEYSTEDTINHEDIHNVISSNCGFPDTIIKVMDFHSKVRFYPCHIAMISRCHYFEMMFALPMSENNQYYFKTKLNFQDNKTMPILAFPQCNFDVFETIIKYFYCDDANIPWSCALDTLKVADFLMDDRLKSMAAVSVTQSEEILKIHSIYDILYTAWNARIERLEHYVAKIFADNLNYYHSMPEFYDAILMSSNRISERQDTDTIELVDDIRYYLLEKYSFEPDDIEFFEEETDVALLKSSGILEYKNDIRLIEKVLEKLKLNA
ncbi:hypothetical protein TPHA_0I02290 [Tetrapisispora phaffii CBS 4417]|uniref:BTB domain-containing protein n=1 Tax=Tetrapisispora phaffii (strain ATCC 24235 / CBS 4417 / NBRC 1672 / NRRL Y-8282 / UCD 70-5) TaxID=1071381 RepID=G8BXV5_TETPH|nr:hypothetical protein TPHA_0I02290 [Tetrapisispora phaffii CBS 4417]CCE64733.1 hypothetical protein TPHA_0I02290 [Tetrapisispora phaffii CBS 4417]